MAESKYDQIAKTIAKKEGVPYNKGKGPDIVTPKRVFEVAVTKPDLNDSIGQLQGFQKPRYLATKPDMVDEAIKITEGTKIGVMDQKGSVKKRAGGRPRKK